MDPRLLFKIFGFAWLFTPKTSGVTPIGAPGARAPAGFLVGHLDSPINNAWAEPLTDRAGGPVGRWAPNVSVRISIGGGRGR